jgi:hypothetical protein
LNGACEAICRKLPLEKPSGGYRMKITLILAVIIILSGTFPVQGEIYKYTDQSGNVHFTDDINQVPEDQRSRMTSYVEAETDSEPEAESPPSATAPAGGTSTSEAADPLAILEGDDGQPLSMDDEKARLEALKLELDEEYQNIMSQKEQLDQERENLKTREDILNYNTRVEKLNEMAQAYEQKGNEYRKQVEEYNRRISDTSPAGKAE